MAAGRSYRPSIAGRAGDEGAHQGEVVEHARKMSDPDRKPDKNVSRETLLSDWGRKPYKASSRCGFERVGSRGNLVC
jgi:hypothetical protein